jgi:pilus assembly protein CpaC
VTAQTHFPAALAGLGFRAAVVALAATLLPAAGLAQERQVRFVGAGDVVLLQMTPSKAMTIQTNVEFSEVVVGDPDIVDISPLTNRSLYLLAKKNGRTNVLFYDAQKKPVGMIDVDVALDIGELKRALASALPSAKVNAALVNGRIRLSGTVPDGVALRTAIDIASQFGTVINTIRVTDAQQVMLQVRFLEVKRDAGRELGVGWNADAGNNRGVVIGVGDSGRKLPSGSAPFGTLISQILDTGVSVDVVVKALETKNLARRLAEPNLVAQSGETASFLAGGEFPIPVPASVTQAATVEYKEYGIRLTFTPIVLDGGLINLRLEPEVSEIDATLPTSINGSNAPALITRRTKTTVELHDGQSFAIAGLLQATNTRSQDQIPWLGQVPVLGALFRSSSYQKRETNLVVIITPHIVRPARPGEPLHSPLDKDMAANDTEFFLLGAMEVTPETLRGYAAGAGAPGAYGHIIDLESTSADVAAKN